MTKKTFVGARLKKNSFYNQRSYTLDKDIKLVEPGGRHSTEVVFALSTQPSRVRFSHLTAGNFEPIKNPFMIGVSLKGPFWAMWQCSSSRVKKTPRLKVKSSTYQPSLGSWWQALVRAVKCLHDYFIIASPKKSTLLGISLTQRTVSISQCPKQLSRSCLTRLKPSFASRWHWLLAHNEKSAWSAYRLVLQYYASYFSD